VLLQVLEAELPGDAIRYSSKIVSIDEEHGGDGAKTIHLADGSALRAKALIGCDGINSVVSRWLGLAKPSHSGRSATRGLAHYPGGHGLQPKFLQFFGHGFRFGYVPCNADDVYWFFTWFPSPDGGYCIHGGGICPIDALTVTYAAAFCVQMKVSTRAARR
jgi:2-polyprenyl-6-methoxyphenol hydroxylase-like FAD-dependent oxidoreductase